MALTAAERAYDHYMTDGRAERENYYFTIGAVLGMLEEYLEGDILTDYFEAPDAGNSLCDLFDEGLDLGRTEWREDISPKVLNDMAYALDREYLYKDRSHTKPDYPWVGI